MIVKYNDYQYDPTEDMRRLIYDVARSPFSSKIEFFVMDLHTFDRLRYHQATTHSKGNLELYAYGPVWTFRNIPIATVVAAMINKESERFVTVVHGYG